MQDPAREVKNVVKGLIEAPTAAAQSKVLKTYFAPDASFDHPLCAVASSPNSRDGGVLPIYQWLRCMFTPHIDVHSVALDKDNNKLYIDATQTLVPSISLLAAIRAPACRLIVVLFLQRGADGRFYIKRQEDYYEPQVLPGLIFPGLSPLIQIVKLIIGFNCWVLTFIIGYTLGWWNPNGSSRATSNGRKAVRA
ncbi:hypothetical protein CBOM_01423 [Ceraceosorus bombacis]|uniref:SigF-like NTF2-like domain-containing protein n=1 Tax=Ceraceosorus bombacis TaxID=401625 RepID=A0A0P1BDE4_9BASI|nr:hypothetical protein CBOM_01423 [Ceraceosorus bombacis]